MLGILNRIRGATEVPTGLSWAKRSKSAAERRSVLARHWLTGWVMLTALMTDGCLLGDAPAYEESVRLGPFVNDAEAEPPLYAIAKPLPAETIQFRIQYRYQAKTADERLVAALHLDLNGSGSADDVRFPPFDPFPNGPGFDVVQEYTAPWTVTDEVTPGCHSLTLVLTYEANMDFVRALPFDESQAAFTTWWINVDDGAGGGSIDDCPGGI